MSYEIILYTCNFVDQDKNVLKDHLDDYSLVPEKVWKKFVAWYGLEKSSQAIPRPVVVVRFEKQGYYSSVTKVQVYLDDFRLALHPYVGTIQFKKFSWEATVGEEI